MNLNLFQQIPPRTKNDVTRLSHYRTKVTAGDNMQKDEHTLKRFDHELEAICSRMMKMGGLVETQFTDAMYSLCHSNISIATQVIYNDRKVNQLEVEIDALCCNAIACYKPTASDLRWLVTATKIIVHLERIGDEIKKIAHMTERRAQKYQLTMPRFADISLAAAKTQTMLKDVLDSFARMDQSAAHDSIEQSHAIKQDFDSILRHLIDLMTDKPHSITLSLEFFLITKALERISDHVRFIALLVTEPANRHYENKFNQKHSADLNAGDTLATITATP